MIATKMVGLVTAAVLLGAVFVTSAAAATGCSPQTVDSYSVKVRAVRNTYVVGDTAKFRVTVNRGANGNDVEPVDDASVVLTVEAGDTVLGGGGKTDASGRVTIKVLLTKQVEAGPADVTVTAERELSYCVHEVGDTHEHGLFRILRNA